jgi:hypothetical protein
VIKYIQFPYIIFGSLHYFKIVLQDIIFD